MEDRWTITEASVGGPGSRLSPERYTLTEAEAREREELERLINRAIERRIDDDDND